MILSAVAALFLSTAPARSDVVSANGSSVSSGASQVLSNNTITINAANVDAGSGLYDLNSVVYFSNTSTTTAQTVTAQYQVNGVLVGNAFTVNVPVQATVNNPGVIPGTTTVALPQQLHLVPGGNQVSLVLKNSTGGASLSVTGSSVNVTGYSGNAGGTANGPGSANLAAPVNAGGAGAVTGLTVNVPGNANAQGLYSLNTALTINNNLGASQTVTARYTVGGVPTGTAFAVQLPSSGSTVLNLPTQLGGLGTGSNEIGIQLTSTGGANSISVGTGSSIYATSYNTAGGVDTASGATAQNQLLGARNTILGGFLDTVSIVVPTTPNTPSFWDLQGSIMLSSTQANSQSISAQYLVNGVANGPTFTLTLPGNGVATFSMPTQFAALTTGQNIVLRLSTPNNSGNFTIDANSLSLVSHNLGPAVGVPEPASMSLATMAVMAFGAAAYRRRKNAKAQQV
jgi:hypothetical protein